MKKILMPCAALALLLAGCSTVPETPGASAPSTPAKAEPAPVADHTSLFPDKNKVSTSVVPDHILGVKALPGGSLAEYEVKGKKYQIFIVDGVTTEKAAFQMLDLRDAMAKGPDYISYMGGYFGTLNDMPLYCFAKLHYLAGILGLPKAEADPLAIQLAAQLH